MARARLLGVSALPHLPGGSSAAAIAAIATIPTTTVATTTPRAAASTIAAGEPGKTRLISADLPIRSGRRAFHL